MSAKQLRSTLGRTARVRPDGLYRVRAEHGEALVTHGPDSERSLTRPGSAANGFGPGSPRRPPVCADRYGQHVIYAHERGTPDRSAAVAADLRAAVGRMNAVLNRNSLASGGGTADFRVLCDAVGGLRIDTLEVDGTSLAEIATAAREAGLADWDFDLTIFLDASVGSSCGVGSYSADDSLSIDNRNNEGGDLAVVYQPCWFTETLMHEVGHNQGAVQPSASNSTGSGGHCNDELDVLCYTPDGGDRNQERNLRCRDRVRFDCGYDDYFDADPEPGSYLATHWNLGSELNRFVSFGPRPANPPPKGGAGSPAADPPESGESGGTPQRTPVQRLRRRARGRAEPGDLRYYRMRVPRRAKALKLQLRSSAPGVELHVRRRWRPRLHRFDCRSTRRSARLQRCKLRRPGRGRWLIAVSTPAGLEVGDLGVRYELRTRVRRAGKR